MGLRSVCVDGFWLCRTRGKDRWGGLQKRNGEEKEYGRSTILYGSSTVPIKIRGETRKKEMRKKKEK